MPDSISTLQEILRLAMANPIQESVAKSTNLLTNPVVVKLPDLSSPEPLAEQLIGLGVPKAVAETISEVYLREAEGLKTETERIVRVACSSLASVPRCAGLTPLEVLQRRIFEAHHQRYTETLKNWATKAKEIALSRVVSSASMSNEPLLQPVNKKKRQFKSEYLPLLEFAFEKDRFPNREDKKHLAKISGMSYRQVCVWFQNRRCRHASRAKAYHSTPLPRTFEEMKERLSISARETLSRAPSAAMAPIPEACTLFTPTLQDAILSSESVKEESSSIQHHDRTISLESSQVSEHGVDSERHNEPEDEGIGMNHIARLISAPSSLSRSHVSMHLNPLNQFKKPTANMFPAIYKPSKLTTNPFVVEPQTWLRSTQAPRTAQVIDPTPEMLESIMEGLDKMDVDVPMSDSDSSLGSLATHKDPVPLTPPHTNALSLRTPLNTHASMPRTFSSDSSVSYSSDASTQSSLSASYSTAPSSVLSSPNRSEICLPNQSEYERTPLTLTAPSPSADEESTCHTPVDEVVSGAGPFDVSSSKLASKARLDEWVSGVSTQQEDDHTAIKWQQLLAAAAAEASPAA